MDLIEFSKKMQNMAANKEALVEAFEGGLNNMYASYMDRIFIKHLKSDGSKIGNYSTKPILVGAKSFRNKGQASTFFEGEEAYTDDTQGFRTLKNKKKAYLLPGGYKKLRELQGMPTTEVNLQYRSELLQSINPKFTENRFVIATIDSDNFKKMIGNDERFGSISFTTKEEKEQLFLDIERLYIEKLMEN